MNISNKEALELVRKLKYFCENKTCVSCCFADDVDGHCMFISEIPCELDIKIFEQQANELIE